MLDQQIHVAIRSYGRAGRVKTIEVAPFAHVWVPESQAAEYRTFYDRVIEIPDEADGGPGRKSNAILDRSPCPWTIILDDDIPKIGYHEGGQIRRVDPAHLWEMIEAHFILAADLGAKLWGINQNEDNLGYQTMHPFSLLSPILGPFTGHLEPELRYDESVFSKDDYDFWLQNIRTHRKTLRSNKYHYLHDHGRGAGGLVGMRTMDREKAAVERMRRKWGPLFRAGGSTNAGKTPGQNNILNSIVKVPLRGF